MSANMTPLTDEQKQFLDENFALVKWAYRRLYPLLSEMADSEEIFAEISYLAIFAVRKWVPERGAFSTYFKHVVRRSLPRGLRKLRGTVHVPEHAIYADDQIPSTVSLDQVEQDHTGREWSLLSLIESKPDKAREQNETAEEAEYWLSKVDERERFVLRQMASGVMAKDIEDKLGLGMGMTRVISRKAIEKIQRLKRRGESNGGHVKQKTG